MQYADDVDRCCEQARPDVTAYCTSAEKEETRCLPVDRSAICCHHDRDGGDGGGARDARALVQPTTTPATSTPIGARDDPAGGLAMSAPIGEPKWERRWTAAR